MTARGKRKTGSKKAAATRRGRYNRRPKAKTVGALGVRPEERLERTRALADQLECESLVRTPHARRVLVETFASASVYLDAMLTARAAGELTADESRTIPTLVSAIRRLAETAALDARMDAGDCRACSGSGRDGDDECAACDGSGVEGGDY